MNEYIQIITTTEKKEDAERIARQLINRRLAACVQIIGPIKSIYQWKGDIVEGEEWLCVIKSRKDIYGKIEEEILELHPYEVPEIIAVPMVDGYERYFKWVDEEVEPER